MAEWQPIESAPKGRRLLLAFEGRAHIGGWDDHWTGQCWVSEKPLGVTFKPYAWQDCPLAPPEPPTTKDQGDKR